MDRPDPGTVSMIPASTSCRIRRSDTPKALASSFVGTKKELLFISFSSNQNEMPRKKFPKTGWLLGSPAPQTPIHLSRGTREWQRGPCRVWGYPRTGGALQTAQGLVCQLAKGLCLDPRNRKERRWKSIGRRFCHCSRLPYTAHETPPVQRSCFTGRRSSPWSDAGPFLPPKPLFAPDLLPPAFQPSAHKILH